MPVIIVNGVADGPIAYLHAGSHGQETIYAIDMMRQLVRATLDPARMRGAVILVPGDVENADGAAAVGPLRRKLPDAGWHSLSLTLPDPDGDPLPLRSAAVAPAEGETSTTESAPASEPAIAAPADGGTPQPEGSAVSPEQRRQAHAERVMARIDAAIAFAAQQQAKEIVLLGHGSGAYWAARYLNERKPANVHNLLMVAAELPAGFAPPLDEAGNSVKGQRVARFLSRRLGLDLFMSAPEDDVR